MDFAGLTINTTIELWQIISLFGIICYFFGRLISDIRPTLLDELGAYTNGFLFVILYLLLPGLFITTFGLDTAIASIVYGYGRVASALAVILLLAAQMVALNLFSKKYAALDLLKYSLKDTVSAAIKKKVRSNILVNLIHASPNEVDAGAGIARGFYFTPMNSLSAFICTSLTVFSLLFALAIKTNILAIVFLCVPSFLNLSMIAILVNYPKEYNAAELDCAGKIKKGKLIKFNKDFITITDNNHVYHVNRNTVDSIKIKVYDKEKVKKELGL